MLTYHEPGAPRYVWLALLIGFTLLKYLPDGKFKQAVKTYHLVAILTLVVIVIPYTIHTLRIGIYPQLAKPWTSMTENALRQQASPPASSPVDMVQEEPSVEMKSESMDERAKAPKKNKHALLKSSISSQEASYYSTQVMQYDPNALTQTGPGMPK